MYIVRVQYTYMYMYKLCVYMYSTYCTLYNAHVNVHVYFTLECCTCTVCGIWTYMYYTFMLLYNVLNLYYCLLLQTHDDEEEYEEEEEAIKSTSRGTSPAITVDHTHSDDDDLSLQSKAKNKGKNSKSKRPVHSSSMQSSSHPVSMITETQRINPQSPVQAVAENWDDEETEDEMFVDAPEFPEMKASPTGSGKISSGNGGSGKGVSNSLDISTDTNTPSKRVQKLSMKSSQKSSTRSEDTKPPLPSNTSRKSSRASQPNNKATGQIISEWNGGGEGKGKEKRVPTMADDNSVPMAADKHGSKSKPLPTKWSSRSESPCNSTNRSVSSSSTGTRGGSYVARVDNEDEESDSWNIQLEPGSSDWTNEGTTYTCTCTLCCIVANCKFSLEKFHDSHKN